MRERSRETFGRRANQAIAGLCRWRGIRGWKQSAGPALSQTHTHTHTHTARWVLSKRAALKEKQTEEAVVLVPAHVHPCFPKGEFHGAVGGAGDKPHPAAPCAECRGRAVLTAEQTHSSQVAILRKEADCQVNPGAAAFYRKLLED